MIKEALSGLIQEIWAGFKNGHSKFGPKEDEGNKFNPSLMGLILIN
jgi:hypothetical protein